jgi:hypothetical protein
MHLLLIPFRLTLLALLLTLALLFAVTRLMGSFARGACRMSRREPRGSSNSAFDEYRNATLQRLEDEAREFRVFLEKLRLASDAADFEAYLKGRRAGSPRAS